MSLRRPQHRSPKADFNHRSSAFVDRGLTVNDGGHALDDRAFTLGGRESALDHRSLTLSDRACAFDHRWYALNDRSLTLVDREYALGDRFHTTLGRVGRGSCIHTHAGRFGELARVARGHARAIVATAQGVRMRACSRTRGRRVCARYPANMCTCSVCP